MTLILGGGGGFGWAAVDYGELFRKDIENNKVFDPQSRPVIAVKEPGPFSEAAKTHPIGIKSEIRVMGLETVRLMKIKVPRLPEGDRWQSLYITDYDGIILGVHLFGSEELEAELEVPVSGVINILTVYVECKSHGVWRTDIKF